MRKLCWIILVFGWIIAIVISAIYEAGPVTLVCVFCAIGSWIGFGLLVAWYYGIRRHLKRHFQGLPKSLQVVRQGLRTHERVDIQRALDSMHSQQNLRNKLFGCGQHFYVDIMTILKSNLEQVAIEWDSIEIGDNRWYQCARNALYLLRHDGEPFAAIVHPPQDQDVEYGTGVRRQLELAILARSHDAARQAISELRRRAGRESIYRDQTISLQKSEGGDSGFTIRLHKLTPVERERIVLPEETLQAVERNVLGAVQHREMLRRAGRSTRHGLLFHGPPGTGKTLATRYLASRCSGHTVILLTGRQLRLIRETFQLARFLAPSLIVLEDVDLIATSRRRNRHNDVLHELLDEMDGLAANADCIVLLTTNRPKALERALAARPGRIDQAVLFPLPDDDCRTRLLNLFGEGLDLQAVSLDRWVRQTAGASPAFLEELIRKAVLFAAERNPGSESETVALTDDDVENAMHELIHAGGELTKRLLGFRDEEDQPAGS